MAKLVAHIKSVQNKSIAIYIIDSVIGSVTQEHVIPKVPSAESREEARRWINDHYQNIQVTEEGYYPDSPSLGRYGALAEDGAGDRALDYPTPPSVLPSIDSSSDLNIAAEQLTTARVRNILDNYASTLQQQYLVAGKNTGVPTYAINAENDANRQNYQDEMDRILAEEELKKYVDVRDNTYVLDGDQPKPKRLEELESRIPKTNTEDRNGHEYQAEYPGFPGFPNISGPNRATSTFGEHSKDQTMGEGSLDELAGKGQREKPPVYPNAKKAVQLDGLPDNILKNLKKNEKSKDPAVRSSNRGLSGDNLIEPVPGYQQAKSEKVISNANNAWIVLGRDRPGNLTSGYGGKGHTQAAAIDICVGRMSPYVRSVDFDNKPIKVDPMFMPEQSFAGPVTDAARIYISQKTDIDDNFKLAKGRIGNMRARSAIALKADAVRIIARDQGIKLVTRGKHELRNSQGGNAKVIRGVDIIANNDDSNLQPMVLGTNLTACLTEMSDIMDNVIGIVQSLVANVAKLDVALLSHFHPCPFFGAPSLPSPTLSTASVASLMQLVSIVTFSNAATKFNMVGFKQKYLGFQANSPSRAPTVESIPITSKYNHVN